MNRRALCLAVMIAGSALAPQARQAATAPPARAAIGVPFDLVNRHIVLPIRVNGSRPLAFVLDTGDKFAVLDLDRARELGLKLGSPIKVGGAGAAVLTGAMVQDASFAIPGVDGFSQPVALAIPLSGLASRLGQDFDGIIGADFIRQFVVEIDYTAQRLRLHDKDTFAYAGPGESLHIEVNGSGHPVADAVVTPVGGEPIAGKFVLDIGSGGSLALHSPFVAAHNLPGAGVRTIRGLGAAGAGGAITGRIGRVDALTIGTFTLRRPHTMFSEDKAGAFSSTVIQGNIGAQILSRFKLFLDYPHERIILEPTPALAAPFDRAFSGMSVEAQGKDYRTFRITEVLEDSPASEAGLQPDDVIAAIDDRDAAEWTLTNVLGLFERPDPRRLTVRRGGQTLKVTITPRQLV